MAFDRAKVDMVNERHANGKPFSITREKKEILLDAIRQGNYIITACRLAGISKDTLLDWIAKGGDDRYTRAVAPEDAVEPYKSFVEEFQRAEAEAEANALKNVTDAGAKDWRASSWVLERRFNQRWGGRDGRGDRSTVVTGGGAEVVITIPDNGRGKPPKEGDEATPVKIDLDQYDDGGVFFDAE